MFPDISTDEIAVGVWRRQQEDYWKKKCFFCFCFCYKLFYCFCFFLFLFFFFLQINEKKKKWKIKKTFSTGEDSNPPEFFPSLRTVSFVCVCVCECLIYSSPFKEFALTNSLCSSSLWLVPAKKIKNMKTKRANKKNSPFGWFQQKIKNREDKTCK